LIYTISTDFLQHSEGATDAIRWAKSSAECCIVLLQNSCLFFYLY